MRLLLLALALACAGAPHAAAQVSPSSGPVRSESRAQSFDAFWPAFRAAVLSGDVDAVAGMTRFPLEVKGELDRDPVRLVTRSELPRLLERALAADSGLSLREPLTNRRLVERTEPPVQPARGVAVSPDAARIAAFVFGRTNAGWRLQRVYLPDD
ncbi:MAG: hypothetical protein ICV73_14080 [Acetobacteraceae bacterium]|nr:hypothetical protein [Acetobacteraceae bacterium]